MTKTINTPLLDAAIEAASTPNPKWGSRYERFVNAKADLVEGVEKKHIWNVDFVAAKDNLSRGIDDVVHKIFDDALPEFWRIRDLSILIGKNYDLRERTFKAHEEFGLSCQMNQAAGRIKRLSKFMDLKHVPEYVGVLKEVVALHELVQAAKPFIEKGRKPAENPTPVDITNTGHCAICGNRQKMNAGQKMVHHGFQITYMGQPLHRRMGSCFGVGYQPSEISCEANIAYIPVLEKNIARNNNLLAELRADKFDTHVEKRTKLEGFRMVEYLVSHKRGTREYTNLRDTMIRRTEWENEGLASNIEIHQAVIKNWKPKAFDWKAA
jgi:hypothetical protein